MSGRIVASVLFKFEGLVGEESVEEDSLSSATDADGMDDPAIDRRDGETSSANLCFMVLRCMRGFTAEQLV